MLNYERKGKFVVKYLQRRCKHFKDVHVNCFCASLLRTQIRTQIHTPRHARARALTNNMNNDRAEGHCHIFAWI